MPLVHMADMLHHAYQNRYAIGAFDVLSPDFVSGVMSAAEDKRAPVILSVAEPHFEHFDFELLMAAAVKAAERATVPVAIHLDRGTSLETAVRAINLGGTGVMVDTSKLPVEDNITQTRAVVDMAHACGIPVEGKPGSVEQVARYAEETGADVIAVSMADIDRLAGINQALKLPLAIQGADGLSDDQYTKLIENGVAKVTIDTALADAAARRLKANAASGTQDSYAGLMDGITGAVQQEAARFIESLGSAGRADAITASCRPCLPVEHVIVFNTENLDEAATQDMMAEGRRVLASIPGVQRVFTGDTVTEKSPYKHCWVVRFSARPVIDSYRVHPAHQDFADNRFRPYAGNRLSIDFEANSTEA